MIKPNIPINSNTLVLLSPQNNPGTQTPWYNKDGDKQTVILKIVKCRSNDTKIAYLILETPLGVVPRYIGDSLRRQACR